MELPKSRCVAVLAATVLATSCVHTSPGIQKTKLSEPETKVSAVSPSKEQVRQKEINDVQPPQPAAPAAEPPAATVKGLSVDDIEFYLKNKVSSKQIAQRIAERGVTFVLSKKVRMRLKKAKADARIFKAINEASAKAVGSGERPQKGERPLQSRETVEKQRN